MTQDLLVYYLAVIQAWSGNDTKLDFSQMREYVPILCVIKIFHLPGNI